MKNQYKILKGIPNDEYKLKTKELMLQYGLTGSEFDENYVFLRWKKLSHSQLEQWLKPTKQLVETTFNVVLEEI